MALETVARHFNLDMQFDIRPPHISADFRYYPEADSLLPGAGDCLKLYDPRRDSDALKLHPENFEQLRSNYPLRREHFD